MCNTEIIICEVVTGRYFFLCQLKLMQMSVFLKSQFSRRSMAVFVVALAVMLASCSLNTLYNQLDYLIPSYVEGMVSLDEMLQEKVEQRSLVLISWHRNTQLQQYAEWLRALQRDANGHLTEEKMLQHIDVLEGFWQSLSLKVNEEMVMLLPLLNAEQRAELFSSIADNNEEFREEYVDVDNGEHIEKYTDSMLDSYETWLGSLTDEQETAVELAAAKMRSSAGLRLERRLQWQRSIQRILEANDSATQKADALGEYFKDFNSRDNDDMKAIENANRQVVARLTVQIVHSMSDEQKAHFVSRADDYIRMFNELAEER